MSNNRPEFYGVIVDGPTTNRQRIGTIALWKHYPAPASRKPPYTGNIQIGNQKYRLAVWENLEVKE